MTSVIMAVVKAVHGHEGEVTGLVQRTQDVQDGEVDAAGAATRLVGVEGLGVERVELDAFGGRVVHLVTADEGAAACPACGVVSTSVKGHTTTRPRDLGYGSRPVRLVWHKRRWRCTEAACPRGSFTESLPAVPARKRLTRRLREAIGAGIGELYRCVRVAAAHHGVSWHTAHGAFVEHAEAPLSRPLPVVEVLGIDETRRGRPVWAKDPITGKWQVVVDRWHTGFVDAAGTGGMLAQVEGRSAKTVIDWVEAQPYSWREQVKYVCIDLSASYAAGVTTALPGATIVADRFHLVRLANQMLTDVRQRVIRQAYGRRGRKTDPAWRARRKLLTSFERLAGDAFVRMWNQLVDTGDPGIEILASYTVKESLRDLLALAGTTPALSTIRDRLWAFYQTAAACSAPEAHRLAETIEAWWPAIEAGLLTGHSNARSEGYNRLAKHEGRNAFGFRNPTNQRRRIRFACTRQHRQVSAVSC